MSIRIHQIGATVFLCMTLSTNVIGQTHEGHSAGMSHAHASTVLPTETGQSAFAAIAEIVALLENDPDTDWSTINIDALRNHLVDMNQLTLSASVTTQELDGKTIQFNVTGDGGALRAIQTMIPAHAHIVRSSSEWGIEVSNEPDGVTVEVTPGSAEDYIKLNALGFFGFMTIGAHHQLHHLQMAKGAGH